MTRFFNARAGDDGATVRPQQHHAFMGQTRECAANDGAADPNCSPVPCFAQYFCTRHQTLSRIPYIKDMRVDNIVLGSRCGRLCLLASCFLRSSNCSFSWALESGELRR